MAIKPRKEKKKRVSFFETLIQPQLYVKSRQVFSFKWTDDQELVIDLFDKLEASKVEDPNLQTLLFPELLGLVVASQSQVEPQSV